MQIKLTSIYVDNQDNALAFYTDVLGFVKKNDVPLGMHRWITVTSKDDVNGVELLLEPNSNPSANTYQKSIYEKGIPQAAFKVDDIYKEYDRLVSLGVIFKTKPTATGTVSVAVFDDTCGNYIQLYQS